MAALVRSNVSKLDLDVRETRALASAILDAGIVNGGAIASLLVRAADYADSARKDTDQTVWVSVELWSNVGSMEQS